MYTVEEWLEGLFNQRTGEGVHCSPTETQTLSRPSCKQSHGDPSDQTD